ncbi:DMT family transporter [Candidatus Pelagibacter sp.]|nr:DMT family transporter [Candidatus Pelagibacter sp.]
MNVINKIPGPILVFMGACCLSFGGLIVKSFEGSTLWQILFWRSLFFSLTVLLFLVITYKKKLFKAFYDSGLPGFLGGVILSFGFCGYVFAMYNTTVANTNFIISTQILFLAIFGYLFLKETISSITLLSIILAITGVLLMIGNSLSSGEMSGNLAAFSMPITFAVLIIIVRKFPNVDMVPAQFIAGVSSCFIGFLLSEKLMISSHDIMLGFTAGFFQVGFGFIFITMGARSTPSAMVGIIMLSESVLGPIWAFLFAGERPTLFTLIGGGIIFCAVLLQFLNLYNKKKV